MELDENKNMDLNFTCLGTALARWTGMSLGLEKICSWLMIDPDKTFTKNTFHMVKYSILQHALLFLPLREIGPSTVENIIIIGGTE